MRYTDIHPEFSIFSRAFSLGVASLSLAVGVAVGLAKGQGQSPADHLGTTVATAALGLLTGMMVAGLSLPLIFVLSWRFRERYERLPQVRLEVMELPAVGAQAVRMGV